MAPLRNSRSAARRPSHGPRATWSLLIAIPLDAGGLYLALAALHLIPQAWPAAEHSSWILAGAAVALFASARAIALVALRRLVHWRAASDAWSKLVSNGPHTR